MCPNCGARGIGKVGSGQYYCWECCVEFHVGRKGWRVFEVLDDGSLAAIAAVEPAPGRINVLPGRGDLAEICERDL